MAGAFGGDNFEDVVNKKNQQDQSEQVQFDESEEVLENAQQVSEDQEDEEDQDDSESEEQQSTIKQQLFEIEERRLSQKLPKILQKIVERKFPYMTPFEKRDINKAKQHKNLKKQVDDINKAFLAKKAQTAGKVMTTVAPVLPFIAIGLVVIVAVVAVVGAVNNMFSWLFPNQGNDKTAKSPFGPKSNSFYGARTIFEDDNLSRQKLVEEYCSVVSSSVLLATGIDSITVAENSSVEVVVKVEISLPDSEFDYSKLDEQTFKQDYEKLYGIVFDLAKIVYKYDQTIDYSGESLYECFDGIKYFGFNADLTTPIAQKVAREINRNMTFESSDNSIEEDLKQKISADINTSLAQPQYQTRAEKLFVQDVMIDADSEDGLTLSTRKYKNIIIMPKLDYDLKDWDIYVFGADNLKVFNNSQEISITKQDGGMEGMEKVNLKNLKLTKFENIDESNLSALTSACSIVDVLKISEFDNSKVISQNEIDGKVIYSFALAGLNFDFGGLESNLSIDIKQN